MSAPAAYLRCNECDVRWETADAAPCWVCGAPGQKAGKPFIQPVAPVRMETSA